VPAVFDIIVLAIILILTIIGWWKGLVKQFFGLAGLIAGYILAVKFYQPCAKFLTGFHQGTARIISFVAIFLACILIAHLIGWAVGRLTTGPKMGFLNRVGGALLGFAKGCVVVCILVILLTAFLSKDHSLFSQSSTVKHILPVAAMLKKVTRGDIKAKYNEKIGNDKPAGQREK
jgi:membrane protein required for colicin V production